MTLAVLLLGAIFTAMDQSWKLTASGREEMERSQLARALIRKFTMDVRSIAYVPPVVTEDDTATSSGLSGSLSSASQGSGTSGSSGSGASGGSNSSSSSSNSSSTSSASSTSDSDVPSPRSLGIRGNALRVEMHISRPRRDLEFSASVDGNKLQTHTSDLRVVTYQLGASGSVANMAGLIRTEGDRLATLLVEEKGSTPTALSQQQALSPEVSTLQFRYFDGRTWYTSWDSEAAGRLPRAVEISIGFGPSQVRVGPALRVATSGSVNQVRSVVMIPISDPLPEEFVQ